MIITPPYAVFDFSFKLCQDKDGSIRSRLTEITIHPDAKECKCKFMQITNILFRKDNLQRRIRTMNHEVNFLKNYRKNIKNNYIFVFNSKTN